MNKNILFMCIESKINRIIENVKKNWSRGKCLHLNIRYDTTLYKKKCTGDSLFFYRKKIEKNEKKLKRKGQSKNNNNKKTKNVFYIVWFGVSMHTPMQLHTFHPSHFFFSICLSFLRTQSRVLFSQLYSTKKIESKKKDKTKIK